MNIALNFDADLSGWLRAFGDVQSRVADATPAHEIIGDKLVDEARDNFETSGGPEKWEPLKPATLRRTPRPGDKPLLVTRDLYNSMTKDVHADYVDGGSSLPYARTQFYGRDIQGKRRRTSNGRFALSTGGGSIPARSPFNWRPGFMQEIGAVYIHHLFGAL